MTNCPVCANAALVPTLLAEDLPAQGCADCHGVLLSLIAYRHWRERSGLVRAEAKPIAKPEEIQESASALKCPKCRGLMTKYAIAPQLGNRLDYCAHCEEAWLDGGEWELVEELAKSGRLTEVFTQPWQRKIREGISEARETERLERLLGGDYGKFLELRDWLDAHPARNQILAHLQRPIR